MTIPVCNRCNHPLHDGSACYAEVATDLECACPGSTDVVPRSIPTSAPVDAAPPKDPMTEIERLMDEALLQARGAVMGLGSREAQGAARAALLSAVASLRARAEEAEDDRYHLQGRFKEACARYERVASSLEKMRERVAGRLDAMRGEAERGFIYGHARTTPDWAEAVNRYGRAIADLRRALDASSPSTPETKDDHR